MNPNKPFEEYTFDELVRYIQGLIILGIPVGKFNDEVWHGCDLVLRWKAAQKKKP